MIGMKLFFSPRKTPDISQSCIKIHDVPVPCMWVSERRKTFAVKWNTEQEQFIIKYPAGCSERERCGFIEKYYDRIVKLYVTRTTTRTYDDGEKILLFGEQKTIRIYITGKTSERYDPQTQEVMLSLKAHSQNAIKRALLSFYTREACVLFPELVKRHSTQMGVRCNGISIRNQRSRWGSASATGRLNFNCRLIMAPCEVIEYVVIHELAHLVHMNHSAEFWKCVEQNMPNFRVHRKWLKSHGMQLTV